MGITVSLQHIGGVLHGNILLTKFSGAYGDRGILSFPVQLTTSRIGNLARLMHTLLNVMTIHQNS